jgi:hypothetical protein
MTGPDQNGTNDGAGHDPIVPDERLAWMFIDALRAQLESEAHGRAADGACDRAARLARYERVKSAVRSARQELSIGESYEARTVCGFLAAIERVLVGL